MTLLERIARFLFDNTGRVISAKSIADYLKSQRLRVGVETVQNYLSYFESENLAIWRWISSPPDEQRNSMCRWRTCWQPRRRSNASLAS